VRRTEDFFIKHGPHSLVAAKFIPGLSTIAPPLAGIVGLGAPLFLLYDGLGAVIWALSGLGIGYVFSDQIEQAVTYAGNRRLPLVWRLASCLRPQSCVTSPAARDVPRITVEQLTEKLRT
jgi:membrane protein DedA with SNARE-associated domain